jgi:hypothetical protein
VVGAIGVHPNEIHCVIDKIWIDGLGLLDFFHCASNHAYHPLNQAVFYH